MILWEWSKGQKGPKGPSPTRQYLNYTREKKITRHTKPKQTTKEKHAQSQQIQL